LINFRFGHHPRSSATVPAAAVLVIGPSPGRSNPEKALFKIHIGPSKTENLTLPQTKRQCDRLTRRITALLGCGQDGTYLFEGVRLDRLHLYPRRLRDARNIARNVSPA
jgi:hypothetical protein